MSTEKYNKEQIRNRMLKYAAAFWGIKKAENFDPVVKLLLEAASRCEQAGPDAKAEVVSRVDVKYIRVPSIPKITAVFVVASLNDIHQPDKPRGGLELPQNSLSDIWRGNYHATTTVTLAA